VRRYILTDCGTRGPLRINPGLLGEKLYRSTSFMSILLIIHCVDLGNTQTLTFGFYFLLHVSVVRIDYHQGIQVQKEKCYRKSLSFLHYSRNIIHRNISYLIYDILDLVQILWKIVLIFMFCRSFLLFLFWK
jgi:hypothetical protein